MQISVKLAIETGRYKSIPRDLRLCNKCEVIDYEKHFFLYCKINDNLRKPFLNDFSDVIEQQTDIDKLIINPDTPQQVKILGSFIKQSLELRTGGP